MFTAEGKMVRIKSLLHPDQHFSPSNSSVSRITNARRRGVERPISVAPFSSGLSAVNNSERPKTTYGLPRQELASPTSGAIPRPETEKDHIIRIYFKDGTFRSYILNTASSAKDVCDMIRNKFSQLDLNDHTLFYCKGCRERRLDDSDCPLLLFKNFKESNEKIMFKHKDDLTLPKKQVVRVYFSDGTFKSFAVGVDDTVKSLIVQVAKKISASPNKYYLFQFSGEEKKQLNDLDSVLDIKCEWSEDSDTIFVFSDSLQPSMKKGFVIEDEKSKDKEQRPAAISSFNPSSMVPNDALAKQIHSIAASASSQATKTRREISTAERIFRDSMQQHAFTNWADYHLAKRDYTIQSLVKDMCDGVLLINLVEILSGKNIGKYNQKQQMLIFERMFNVSMVTGWLSANGVQLRGYGPEDILDGNINAIMNILWPLIYASSQTPYDLNNSEKVVKQTMLEWCRQSVHGYMHVKIDNFDYSWQDGLGFCALINKYRPDLLDYNHALSAGEHRLDLVVQLLYHTFGVPFIINPVDLKKKEFKPDEKSVFAFLSVLKEVLTCN